MCYKELWQKQKAEKEKKWIDNHKGADVAWCSQELIPTLHGREGKLNVVVYIIYFPCSIIYLTSPTFPIYIIYIMIYSPYKKEYIIYKENNINSL